MKINKLIRRHFLIREVNGNGGKEREIQEFIAKKIPPKRRDLFTCLDDLV
jgi:hypothetical protein